MNNDDERDYLEEADNRRVLEDPDGDSPMSAHTALANGLRALADWIELHPHLPMPWWPDFGHVLVPGPDDTPATVAAIATALGTRVETSRGGHVRTERMFGPLRYHVGYIPAEALAAQTLRDSYADNVVLTAA